MVEDRIEREVVIAASQQRVWEIITQAEHVGKWFSDGADIDLRPGGAIVIRWDKHGTMLGTVEKVEAPHVFSYRWNPGMFDEQPTPETSTLVEFTLTPLGDSTQVRVVETGFKRLARSESELGEQFKQNSNGWAVQMRDLNEYVEQIAVGSDGR